MKIKPHFIIGLGNPGSRYTSTYHNVGFLVVDHLLRTAAAMTLIQKGEKKNFEFIKFANNQTVTFIKPLTFMNDSGKAVAASLKYFSARAGEILVIHDDSDIKFGKMKLSFGRGAAGHHGVESIISNLKTKNFWRLRIGIRKTGLPADFVGRRRLRRPKAEAYRAKAGEFVLKKITPADKLVWERLFSDLKIL